MSVKSELPFGFSFEVIVKTVFSVFCVSFNPPATSIEAFIGFAQWSPFRTPTHFVRNYWYIEPSPENRPNIVLLRMNGTITFNPNVHPIRLPFYQDFAYEDWSSLILGFRTPDGPSTPHLQSAEASILNNNLCNFGLSDVTHAHEICAIDGGESNQSGPIRRFNAFTGKIFFRKLIVS